MNQVILVSPSKEDVIAAAQEITSEQGPLKKNLLCVIYDRDIYSMDCNVAPSFNIPGIDTLRITSASDEEFVLDLVTLVLESEHCKLKRVEIMGEWSRDLDRFREAVLECESLCELSMPCRDKETYDCLVEMIPHCKLNMLCLQMKRSRLAELAEALALCPTITRLDFSDSTFKSGLDTAQFFKSLPNWITELCLDNCDHLDMPISKLISRLPEFNLRVLGIKGTTLLPSSAIELASNLGSLQELNVEECQIDIAGMLALARALRQEKGCQLRVLKMRGNEFSDACLQELCESLPCCQLEVLSMPLYGFTENTFMRDFVRALRSDTCMLTELNPHDWYRCVSNTVNMVWGNYKQAKRVLAMLTARSVLRVGGNSALRKLPAEILRSMNDMMVIKL